MTVANLYSDRVSIEDSSDCIWRAKSRREMSILENQEKTES